MKKFTYTKLNSSLSISLILVFFCNSLIGQETIIGIIKDSISKSPMEYANISLQNLREGTISDSNGNFNIKVSREDTLVISFLGYKTLKVATTSINSNQIFYISPKSILLDEVTIEKLKS